MSPATRSSSSSRAKPWCTRTATELNRVGPGAYFGELAILDGGPRSATVVAHTDVKVAVIGIRMFRTMLREFSDLAEQLLIALAAELRAARQMGQAN